MILINAYNIIKGGGINVAHNVIDFFSRGKESLIVVIPRIEIYKNFIFLNHIESNPNVVKVIYISAGFERYFLKYYMNKIYLPYLVKKYGVTKVYSLGNIAFPCTARQFVLIQNAYATLFDEKIWLRIPFLKRLYLKLMQNNILNSLKFAQTIGVQTNTMKEELIKATNIREHNIIVYPNVVRTDRFSDATQKAQNYITFKMLFISKLYPHKNFEVLEPLANLFVQNNLPVTITLTLDVRSKGEKKVADYLTAAYPTVFHNAGYINYRDLPDLYLNHNALFFPTLLESYSATYIEAMIFKLSILTSDLPFAKELCKDAAFYFQPFDIDDIYNVICLAIKSKSERENKILRYQDLLNEVSGSDHSNVNKILLDAI